MKSLLTTLDAKSRQIIVAAGVLAVALILAMAAVFTDFTIARNYTLSFAAAFQDAQVDINRLNRQRILAVTEISPQPNADVARLYQDIDARSRRALARLLEETATEEERVAARFAAASYEDVAAVEREALALIEEGRGGEGMALLDRDYIKERTLFLEAMEKSRLSMWARLEPENLRMDRDIAILWGLGPVTTILLGVILLLAARRARLRTIDAAVLHSELSDARNEIAKRDRQAHSMLIARSPAPLIELDFAPASKLVAWLKGRDIEDLDRWLKIYPGEIRKLAPQLRLRAANRAAAAMLAGSKGADHLRELRAWLPERSLHMCVLAILRALWDRQPDVVVEIEARTPDGAPRCVELKGQVARWEPGRPPSLVALVSDTSDTSRLRTELTDVREDAERAARVHDEFINTISRDLRAPLDGVLGMATALGRSRLDRQQHELLSVIVDSAQVMRDTLDRARDYTRLEAGALELQAEPFDVGVVAQAVNARFTPQARAKNLRFRMSVDDDARGRFVGDEDRVRQVFSKLVANAIGFTPNGEVEAKLSIEPGENGANLLVMTVRDTGAGLTPAELASAMGEGVESSGGGLALCRRLCTAMGGGLDIKSSSDYGTTVTARVAVWPAPADAESDEVSDDAPVQAEIASTVRLKVLAADDNAINRAVLRDLLDSEPLDLTLVENGADALAAWRAQHFDVFLLDVHMPLLSGHDVAREIRRIEETDGRARMPIIAVSASVMKAEVDACLESGMDAHVPKPIEPAKLKQAIRDVLAASAEPHTAADAATA